MVPTARVEFFFPAVLASWGCCIKISWTAWLKQVKYQRVFSLSYKHSLRKGHIMRRRPSARKEERSHQKPTMFLPGPWTPSFQNCNVFTGREREQTGIIFYKALIPSDPGPTLMISSDPNYLPKGTFPNAITLGLGLQYIWEDTVNTTEKRLIMLPCTPAISLSQLIWASDDFRRRLASTFVIFILPAFYPWGELVEMKPQ